MCPSGAPEMKLSLERCNSEDKTFGSGDLMATIQPHIFVPSPMTARKKRLDKTFDKVKLQANRDLVFFLSDLRKAYGYKICNEYVPRLEQSSPADSLSDSTELIESLKTIMLIAQRCLDEPIHTFKDSITSEVDRLEEMRKGCSFPELKHWYTRLLFILTRCSRLLIQEHSKQSHYKSRINRMHNSGPYTELRGKQMFDSNGMIRRDGSMHQLHNYQQTEIKVRNDINERFMCSPHPFPRDEVWKNEKNIDSEGESMLIKNMDEIREGVGCICLHCDSSDESYVESRSSRKNSYIEKVELNTKCNECAENSIRPWHNPLSVGRSKKIQTIVGPNVIHEQRTTVKGSGVESFCFRSSYQKGHHGSHMKNNRKSPLGRDPHSQPASQTTKENSTLFSPGCSVNSLFSEIMVGSEDPHNLMTPFNRNKNYFDPNNTPGEVSKWRQNKVSPDFLSAERTPSSGDSFSCSKSNGLLKNLYRNQDAPFLLEKRIEECDFPQCEFGSSSGGNSSRDPCVPKLQQQEWKESTPVFNSQGEPFLHSPAALEEYGSATIDDFEIIKLISRGAFGRVYLARKKSNGELFALKVMRKADLVRKNMVQSARNERNILAIANNPFVIRFYYSFTSKDNLYIVMEYSPGGDLASLLKSLGALDEDALRQYAAEIVLALEYCHDQGIIHRDLKPDNVLIAADGHVKLTDFGLSCFGVIDRTDPMTQAMDTCSGTHSASNSFPSSPIKSVQTLAHNGSIRPSSGCDAEPQHMASLLQSSEMHYSPNQTSLLQRTIIASSHVDQGRELASRTSSTTSSPVKPRLVVAEEEVQHAVGTPDYLAPELLLGTGHGMEVDWWSLGVILFEAVTGSPPFNDDSPEKIFHNILERKITWPEPGNLSDTIIDLIDNLLCPDPDQRLGRYGAEEVMVHPWFSGIDWEELARQKEDAFVPFVPAPSNETDTSYFISSKEISQKSIALDLDSAWESSQLIPFEKFHDGLEHLDPSVYEKDLIHSPKNQESIQTRDNFYFNSRYNDETFKPTTNIISNRRELDLQETCSSPRVLKPSFEEKAAPLINIDGIANDSMTSKADFGNDIKVDLLPSRSGKLYSYSVLTSPKISKINRHSVDVSMTENRSWCGSTCSKNDGSLKSCKNESNSLHEQICKRLSSHLHKCNSPTYSDVDWGEFDRPVDIEAVRSAASSPQRLPSKSCISYIHHISGDSDTL